MYLAAGTVFRVRIGRRTGPAAIERRGAEGFKQKIVCGVSPWFAPLRQPAGVPVNERGALRASLGLGFRRLEDLWQQ